MAPPAQPAVAQAAPAAPMAVAQRTKPVASVKQNMQASLKAKMAAALKARAHAKGANSKPIKLSQVSEKSQQKSATSTAELEKLWNKMVPSEMLAKLKAT